MRRLTIALLALAMLLPVANADSQAIKAAIKPGITKLLQLIPNGIKEEYLKPKIENAVDDLKKDAQDLAGDSALADFLADKKVVKKAVTDDAIAEYVYSSLESNVKSLSQWFTKPALVKDSFKKVQKQESKPPSSGGLNQPPTPAKKDVTPSSAGSAVTTGLEKVTFSIPRVYPNAESGEQCINDGSCQEGLKCKPWPGGKLAGNFCQGEKISATPVVCSGDQSSTAYMQCVADSYIPKNEYTTGKDRLPSVQSIDALQCNQDSDCTAALGSAHFCGAIVSGTPRVCLTGLRPKAGFVECDSGSGCTVPQDVCVLIAAEGKHPDPVHARGAACVPS